MGNLELKEKRGWWGLENVVMLQKRRMGNMNGLISSVVYARPVAPAEGSTHLWQVSSV